MLTTTTPRNYRAQCETLAFLRSRITTSLADPNDPTQVNPDWAATAAQLLKNKGASRAAVADFYNWVEDQNESGRLTGSAPEIPVPVTHPVQRYQHAVDDRGNVQSTPTAAGVYAISGGALLIRGRVRG